MSINLMLLPVRFDFPNRDILIHTKLPLDIQCEDVFRLFRDNARPLERSIILPDEMDSLPRAQDAYGNALTYMVAGEICVKVLNVIAERQRDEFWNALSDWDSACFAFIKELKYNNQVILYWH